MHRRPRWGRKTISASRCSTTRVSTTSFSRCGRSALWPNGSGRYIVYGPLALAASSVVYEGLPTYPDAGRPWRIAQELDVNIFHTSPTATRALRRAGPDEPAKVVFGIALLKSNWPGLTPQFLSRPLWVNNGHLCKLEECPLYPQKRTSLSAIAMSAKCQKQTFAKRGMPQRTIYLRGA